jgi:hypothetical protein
MCWETKFSSPFAWLRRRDVSTEALSRRDRRECPADNAKQKESKRVPHICSSNSYYTYDVSAEAGVALAA